MREYQVGDIIRIRSDLEGDREYAYGCFCVDEAMTQFRGEIATITEANYEGEASYYRLDIDRRSWSWVWDMFDPNWDTASIEYTEVKEDALLGLFSS